MRRMTQRQEEAERLCYTFRENAETIWRYYDSATMSLPYHYSNGIVAMVRVKVMEDGRVYVSDNGGAAPNEGLTIQNVKRICRKHSLRYETIDEIWQCRCAVTCTVSSRRKILYRLSGISSKRFWKHDIREARREVDELL